MSSGWGPYLAGQPGYSISTRIGGVPPDYGVTIQGYNPDIPLFTSRAAPEHAWTQGGAYPWSATGTVATVYSDNAADSAADIGARTLAIQGIDLDGAERTEFIELDGVNPVAGTTVWQAIFASAVATAGLSEVNLGRIAVELAGVGVSYVEPDYGRSLQSNFVIPSTWKNGGLLTQIYASTIERVAAAVQAEVRIKPPGGAWTVGFLASPHSYSPGVLIGPDAPGFLAPGVCIEGRFIETSRGGIAGSLIYEIIRP